MKFQVPQFIEVEDKIFGPLTIKQFIYLAGGGGLSVALFLLLPKIIAVVIILPVLAFSLAMAFYKVNNRAFIFLLQSVFTFFLHDRLYVWRKEENLSADSDPFLPSISQSKLKDITFALDTREDPLHPNIEK